MKHRLCLLCIDPTWWQWYSMTRFHIRFLMNLGCCCSAWLYVTLFNLFCDALLVIAYVCNLRGGGRGGGLSPLSQNIQLRRQVSGKWGQVGWTLTSAVVLVHSIKKTSSTRVIFCTRDKKGLGHDFIVLNSEIKPHWLSRWPYSIQLNVGPLLCVFPCYHSPLFYILLTAALSK